MGSVYYKNYGVCHCGKVDFVSYGGEVRCRNMTDLSGQKSTPVHHRSSYSRLVDFGGQWHISGDSHPHKTGST